MPLPFKRSLEELDEDEEDYYELDELEEEEEEELHPSKRLKQYEQVKDNDRVTNQGVFENDAKGVKGAARMPQQEQHQQQGTNNDSNPAQRVADLVLDALLPRLESRLNETVNSVALRMLEALGGRLNKLESRMSEMQQEWRDALQAEEDEGEDEDEDVEVSQAKQKNGYWRHKAVQDQHGRGNGVASAPNADSLQGFFQEAANVAHHSTSPEYESANGSMFAPPNRKKPNAVRRERFQPTPEHRGSGGSAQPTQGQRGEERRITQTGLDGETPLTANIEALVDVPQHKLDRSIGTVVKLWREFFIGSPGKPAINELDRRYGSEWRHRNSSESVYYGLRRTVIDELVNRVEKRGVDLEASSEQVASVWQAVAEEMDAERTELNASLNQYIQEIKRRERVKTLPQPPPEHVYDPLNGPAPPPQPVLSRTTPTVQELWKEWFEGKDDYMGHEKFPSIIALNQRWGDQWRRWRTPEYSIYLKRRCIIDIALKRILAKEGDTEANAQVVLKEMDEERDREGLSLVQYNYWLRAKHNYHAALRGSVPMEFVEQGRVGSNTAVGAWLGGNRPLHNRDDTGQHRQSVRNQSTEATIEAKVEET